MYLIFSHSIAASMERYLKQGESYLKIVNQLLYI